MKVMHALQKDMLCPDLKKIWKRMAIEVGLMFQNIHQNLCTYKKVLHMYKITHTSNLMMKVDPTAGRYSLPRFERESEK